MGVRAYLALGSNVGDRETHLRLAIKALDDRENIVVTAVSQIYETDPVGYADQGAFLNMVVVVDTQMKPDELLTEALAIEQELGRVRTVRWGPRVIDLDILLYDHLKVETEHLRIPHPAMVERAFVLVPLRDVWEGGRLPFFQETIETYIELAEDGEGVRKWGAIDWVSEFGPSGG